MLAQNLFITDLTEYDFILHLDPRHNTRTAESIAARTDVWVSKLWEGHIRNQVVAGMAANSIKAGFDPASMLLADLQRMYGEQAIFFHDKHGGQVIAGLWNPDVLQHRNFKPFLGYSVKPVVNNSNKVQSARGRQAPRIADSRYRSQTSTMTVINKESILSEIGRLGHGLVTKVEVLKHK